MRAKKRTRDALDCAGHVDIRRLVRLYGADTANEVLCKLVIACAREQAGSERSAATSATRRR
jgi:hypothetical protein